MKRSVIGFLLGWVMVASGAAQMVLPGGSKHPATRPIGGGINGGVDGGVNGRATITREGGQPKSRYTTHVVLADSRTWHHLDGRSLEGKLLAFEDLVIEVPAGGAAPPAPVPPANPTVVRNGKVRLQVGKQIFELALTSLAQADQDFVATLRAGLAKKTPVKP